MSGDTIVLWITALGLFAGTIAIALVGGASTPAQAARTSLHAAVTLIAAIAYTIMAAGGGAYDFDGDGVLFEYVRYADWAITTPLLLLALSITALPSGRRAHSLIAALLFANVAMIGAGLVAGLTEGWTSAMWFVASTLAFLVVLAILWSPLREMAEGGHPVRTELYVRHAGVLTGLWSLYPFVFLAGMDGAGLMGPLGTVLGFAVLDIASKVGFGLLVVLEDGRLAKEEGVERAWPPARTQLETAMATEDQPPRPAAPPPAPVRADDTPVVAPSSPLPEPAAALARAGTRIPPRIRAMANRVPRERMVAARNAMLARYHATAPAAAAALRRPMNRAETLAWLKARGIDARRFAADLPAGTRLILTEHLRRPAPPPPPPPAPRRKRRPKRLVPGAAWPIGALRPSDAVPVAIAAAVLVFVAWPRKPKDEGAASGHSLRRPR